MPLDPLVELAIDSVLLLAIAANIVLFADFLRRVHVASRDVAMARLFVEARASPSAWYVAVGAVLFLISSFLLHAVVSVLSPSLVTDPAFDTAYGVLGIGGFALVAASLVRVNRRISERVSPLVVRAGTVGAGERTRP